MTAYERAMVVPVHNENDCGTQSATGASSKEPNTSSGDIALQLSQAIKSVAQDLCTSPPRRFAFEGWVRFRNLIRPCGRWDLEKLGSFGEEGEAQAENGESIDWDWLGEDSPLLADCIEVE